MIRFFQAQFCGDIASWVADHAGQIRAVVSFREIGLRGLRHPSAILGRHSILGC